ncbi:MAG TPA: inosine/xanthosine triphosphatase [Nitrolancea sp.]|nr:inosine/xanthosine triphosphatase [Nitrolancea sp.]
MTAEPARIAVGTTNPAKLDGVARAARDIFGTVQIEAISIDLDVPVQPWGDDETARGALARAQAAMAATDAAYGVGIESGLVEGPGGRIYVIAWAAVVDRAGGRGFGGSERFALPAEFEAELWHGAELGPLLDARFGKVNLAQHQGAVGLFSDGRRERAGVLALAVLHAFLALLEPWRKAP